MEPEEKPLDSPKPGPVFKKPGLPHRPKVALEPEIPTAQYKHEEEEEKPAPTPYGLSLLPEEKPDEDEEEEKKAPSVDEIPCLYTPPFWSGRPSLPYKLELIKEGVSRGSVPLNGKGWYLFGRVPICDIQLDHPSISRQHAVIQYRKNVLTTEGDAFLYDLGSTHGTFLGKRRLKPKEYVPIIQGNNLIRFGQSKRLYVLDGSIIKNNSSSEEEEDNLGEIVALEDPNEANKNMKERRGEERRGEDPNGGQKKASNKKKRRKNIKEKKENETKNMPPKKKRKGKGDEDEDEDEDKYFNRYKEEDDDDNDEEEDEDEDGDEDKDKDESESEPASIQEHREFFMEYYKDDEEDEFYDRTGRIAAKKRVQKNKQFRSHKETYDTLVAKRDLLNQQMQELKNELAQLHLQCTRSS